MYTLTERIHVVSLAMDYIINFKSLIYFNCTHKCMPLEHAMFWRHFLPYSCRFVIVSSVVFALYGVFWAPLKAN